jgi:ketosteroid isomerase-like protein
MDTAHHRQVVETLWQAFNALDFEAAAAVLHEDFICEWPQSQERIRGKANFIAVNQAYPGQWTIRILKAVACGQEVVTEVEVDLIKPDGAQQLDRAVSFFTLRDGKIIFLREFWPEPYAAPDWRAQWVEKL